MLHALDRPIPPPVPRPPIRDTVTLIFDDRHRRRRRLITDHGLEFVLDLPEAAVLRDGDLLRLEDDSWLEIRAAIEDLLEIGADSPGHLARLAWHLGNRHLSAAIGEGRILIRPDHVIAAMLQGLGATLRPVRAAFNPEAGAYHHAGAAPGPDHRSGRPHTHDHAGHPHD